MLLNGVLFATNNLKGIGMKFLKHVGLIALAAAAMLTVSAGGAFAYYGGWHFDNNAGGWEILSLGDSDDGTYLHLEGDAGRCGTKGASYAKMRSILNNNDGDYIDWWIDADCGDLVRICLENKYGQSACSTYWYVGWNDSKY
jgi:hypothetical protein